MTLEDCGTNSLGGVLSSVLRSLEVVKDRALLAVTSV